MGGYKKASSYHLYPTPQYVVIGYTKSGERCKVVNVQDALSSSFKVKNVKAADLYECTKDKLVLLGFEAAKGQRDLCDKQMRSILEEHRFVNEDGGQG